MSFYNMIHGVNQATFFILPMLAEKHPDDYPRFRDCFVTENNEIAVYTRVGGGNRNEGYGEEWLQQHPSFLRDQDDDFDSTYATYFFSVPDEFKTDFDLIMGGKINECSEKYKQRVIAVYPKIEEQLRGLFYPNPITQ